MSHPIIHLEEYYLEKVLIERKDSDPPGDHLSIAYDFDYSVQRSARNPQLFLLTFIVRDDPEAKTPHPQIYNLDFRIQGIFRFDEGLEEQKMQYLVRVNGGTILYGILRGMLATMTGAFPEGRLNLPTLMMADVVRKVEERHDPKTPDQKPAATKKAKATKKTAAKKQSGIRGKTAKKSTP